VTNLVRGTRLLVGGDAARRRALLAALASEAEKWGCAEVVLPSLEFAQMYRDKAGEEVLGQMYVFPDRKGRELCLRPEGTATCQEMARTTYAHARDVMLWYEARCWRYERPQAGRYREFTQFGVEVLNPSRDWTRTLIDMAERMVRAVTTKYVVTEQVARGLGYYTAGGFEIACPSLGAQQQVCGGGPYAEGIGFAIGVDRLMLAEAAP
jgi:histidyl-tRNA synthetase